ncbi:hypothetical protein [Pseudoalteromonas tunicata]|uniref:hypothetical protein n=1 Tax=Pseudoalteromonas tunicata TaxID=314281 RepID=UPI00273EBF61|nr:hypothetical protein [Pseudoalteromonas tunicata]MDP4985339.1 hypothetical protein [Pseudoalteromonas tunicata]
MKIKLILPLLACLGVSQSVFAAAASITFSQYRIILDKDTQGTELSLRNDNEQNAECLLDLNYYNFSVQNEVTETQGASDTYMPANKLLRYSPRSVTIPGKGLQTVKISYRHRANLATGEYLNFFRISCSEKDLNPVLGQPSLGAKINYNIPVHVRIGDAVASSAFEVSAIKPVGAGYELTLKQTREGTRSVIGDVKILDKGNDDELGYISNFSLYRPAEFAIHKIMLAKKPTNGVVVEFEESKSVYMPVKLRLEIPASEFL